MWPQVFAKVAPEREETEQIENRIVTKAEIQQLIASGKVRDAKSLIGLYYYMSNSA